MDVLLWPGPPSSLSREVFFLFSFFLFFCLLHLYKPGWKNGEHLCECECTRPKSLADLFFFFDSLGDAKYDGYVLFQANKQQWPLTPFCTK